jgi:hypothetical protein
MKTGKSGPLSGSIKTRLYGGNSCNVLAILRRVLCSETAGFLAICVLGSLIGWVICDAMARGLI